MSNSEPITRLNAALEDRYRIEDQLGVGVLARMDQNRRAARTQGGHESRRLDKLGARTRDNGPIQAQCAVSVRGIGVYIVIFSSRGGE